MDRSRCFCLFSFAENRAEFGGAVHIIPLERVLQLFQDFSNFTGCLFAKNRATKGGAIYARSSRLNNEVIPGSSPSLFSIRTSQVSENRYPISLVCFPKKMLDASQSC